MNDIIFTLLVLGCSHNLDVCREVATEPVVFQSIEDCEKNAQPAARSVGNFPMAVVQCLPVDASAADKLSQADWYFAADGTLQIAVPASASEVVQVEDSPAVEPIFVAENDNG